MHQALSLVGRLELAILFWRGGSLILRKCLDCASWPQGCRADPDTSLADEQRCSQNVWQEICLGLTSAGLPGS